MPLAAIARLWGINAKCEGYQSGEQQWYRKADKAAGETARCFAKYAHEIGAGKTT